MADDVGTSGEGEQGELVKRSLHEAALQYCYYFGFAVNGEEDSGWVMCQVIRKECKELEEVCGVAYMHREDVGRRSVME